MTKTLFKSDASPFKKVMRPLLPFTLRGTQRGKALTFVN